ncbi:hypothetical protein [Allosphingosinicella sp.]|uniref:hypothetical protein n=1 Tax=Allosphingosinicella sp. TaxID=2823234 RepID=UPI002EDAB376
MDLLRLPSIIRKLMPRIGQGIVPKLFALFGNLGYFRTFDALVVPERTTLLIRRLLPRRIRMIWTRHGAGDRANGFEPEIAKFDFVLMAGSKIEQRLLEQKLIKPGQYATGVYAKFDLVRRMPHPPLFDNGRPTVVYNPHFWRSLSSWPTDGQRVLDFFACSDRFNLIFAPHIRLFYPPRPDKYDDFSAYMKLPHMHIDLGSEASADMTYLFAADLYLGDVSSQVAEFLVRPRPCVFLNSHHVDWAGDPNYRFWTLGPVVDDVAGLESALDEALSDDGKYRALQLDYVRETFAEAEHDTAPKGADAIMKYLAEAN